MAASESLSNGATADSGPLKPTETNGRFLELPEHMKQVASSSSLAPSEYSDRDELNWSSRSSVEQDRTDLAIIEGCVEDLALAPIHLQELLTDDFEAIFPTSPVGSQVGEKEGLRTPTSPRTPSAEGQRTLVQKYLLWGRLSGPFLVFTLIGLLLILIARSHLMQILNLLERLPWFESCVIFIFLFTLVSFPFGIGYIVLNMMAGYLYGFLHGQLVVMVSVAVGFTISFFLCRIWFREYAKRIVTSNALQAIMRVVEGKNGVKVIILTRLTPIPFGLQNVLFSMTSVSYWKCLVASVVGLLPTQCINTYMGSTVRNMQEVLGDRADGYIILIAQVLFSIVLMFYLLRKARQELAKLTMENAESSGEEKKSSA